MKRSFSFGVEIVCPAGELPKPVFLGLAVYVGYSLFGRRALFSNLAGRIQPLLGEQAPLKTGVDGAGGAAKLRERKWASLEGERGPAPREC